VPGKVARVSASTHGVRVTDLLIRTIGVGPFASPGSECNAATNVVPVDSERRIFRREQHARPVSGQHALDLHGLVVDPPEARAPFPEREHEAAAVLLDASIRVRGGAEGEYFREARQELQSVAIPEERELVPRVVQVKPEQDPDVAKGLEVVERMFEAAVRDKFQGSLHAPGGGGLSWCAGAVLERRA
jgi:hypothetical protein